MSEIPYMMEDSREEFERVRNLAWPRPPAPALTAEEAAIVAVFEAAPVPPEACRTCRGLTRETVGMVCQICGTDYAPVPDERVETVARAIADSDYETVERGWAELDEGERNIYRRLAAAAIAALPPSPAACGVLSASINFGGDSDAERLMCELPVGHGGAHQHDNGDGLPPTRWVFRGPSPAEEAVKRVEALAEEFDSATLPPLINDFDRGLVAGYARAANRIRGALASPAPAPQDKPCPECGTRTDVHDCDRHEYWAWVRAGRPRGEDGKPIPAAGDPR